MIHFTMIYTCIDAKAYFNHILDKVLVQVDGLPLKLGLTESSIDGVFSQDTLRLIVIDSL
jgi:hypothetical protein